MSCKGADIQQRVCLTKFEEHKLAARQEIVLLIFHTDVSKFYRNLRLGFSLQTNVWGNENLNNCGFSSEAM